MRAVENDQLDRAKVNFAEWVIAIGDSARRFDQTRTPTCDQVEPFRNWPFGSPKKSPR